MSANFKSRFMNRMEHITRSGHTSTQNKSSASTPSQAQLGMNRRRTPNHSSQTTQEFSRQIPNVPSSVPNSESHYAPTPQLTGTATPNAYDHWNRPPADAGPVVYPQHEPSGNKLTAQQFQNYLEECSPVHHQPQYQQMSAPLQQPYQQNPNHNQMKFAQFQQFQPLHSQMAQQMGVHAQQMQMQYEPSYRGPPTAPGLDTAATDRLYQQPAYQQSQSHGPYGGHRNYRETQSEDLMTNATHSKRQKKRAKRGKSGKSKASSSNAKSAAPRRPVSLEFSRKPRKTSYTPHTLNDLRAITGAVSMGTGALGPDLEDEAVRIKAVNLKKVQQYAELVNLKNRAHRPKPKGARPQAKSKTQIAREYAVMVSRLNHQKQMKLKHDRSRGFKMTGNAAISGSSSASPHRALSQRNGAAASASTHKCQSIKESKQRQEKLVELQQLHIRNRAIAQHILHDTFG